MKSLSVTAILSVLSLAFASAAFGADDTPKEVLLFKHSALPKSGALQENSAYKVQIGRREGPGQVEIHTKDTDVFYILSGTATFVTGGQGVGMKEVRPNELRGDSIEGGTERHLAKGDVIIIPHGTPHQFTQVDAPFVYFVVKVTE